LLPSSGETGTDGTSGTPACVCIASTWRSRWSQLSRGPLLLPLRRFLGPSGRITAYHGTSGWLAMLELKRRSGSRSPCSGSQTAWRPFSAWPLPNASSASREPSPASEKQASPSGFFCLFCLIAPHIHAPYSLFPFHPSTSLRADLLPIPVELTGNPESRLEHFGELIAHVVGPATRATTQTSSGHCAAVVEATSVSSPRSPSRHTRSLRCHSSPSIGPGGAPPMWSLPGRTGRHRHQTSYGLTACFNPPLTRAPIRSCW